MNCDLCRARCKGDCCRGPIPMPKALLSAHPHVRPATHVKDIDALNVMVMHVTKDNHAICPFLDLDDKCSIYEHRPAVCREFGSESHIFMTCSYLSKDDRVRGRQERRDIERQQQKAQSKRLA